MHMPGGKSKNVSATLLLRIYFELLRVDYWLSRFGFPAVHAKVRNFARSRKPRKVQTWQEICDAVDITCVLYFKQVQCLQRSAVMVRLLRDNGIPAELIIGVQQWPFRAHAWVEVAGQIVGDKPYISGMYEVIERC